MAQHGKFYLKILATLVFFLVFYAINSVLTLSSFAKVEIDAQFDHPETIDIFYSISTQFQENLSARTMLYPAGTRVQRPVELKNHIARRMRLDLGEHPGKVALYGLVLHSFFGAPITLTPAQIAAQFVPNGDITAMTLHDDHLALTIKGTDAQLTARRTFKVFNPFIGWIVPALFAFVFFLFLERFSFAGFPAFADVNSKASSMGSNISALDGVRGFAALAILAEHVGFLKGIGYLGILFFFALSGFLLSAPFIQKPERAVSYSYMTEYLLRRLRRIMPMHYVIITILFLFHGKIAEGFRNLIYVQSDGILWTVVQELFFYLVLPMIMAAIYFFFKGKKGWTFIFCCGVILLSDKFLSNEVISLYGNSIKNSPKIGIFLSGVAFAYLTSWFMDLPLSKRVDGRLIRHASSVAGMLLFALFLVFAFKCIPSLRQYNPLDRADLFGFLSGLFIALTVAANTSWLGRLAGCYPLRAIGVVSYSFYLLHPVVLSMIRTAASEFFSVPHLTGWPMFLIATACTYFLATLTYTYIERPFLKLAR